MTDYRSRVPFFAFPDTLAEQEAVLASHPMTSGPSAIGTSCSSSAM
ncbi:MAG: hypothetical protein OXP36_08700 [Gammaproteobacteria bacterium]|nr:hypothetical protein [Gammaproteobacteria bacterium]